MRSFFFLLPRPAARRALFSGLTAAAAASVLTVIFTGTARAADPPRYTAVDLGTLSDGNGEWRGHLSVRGINSAGDMAGSGLILSDSPPRAVFSPLLYTGGAWTDLSAGGRPPGEAYNLNNTGTAVGVTYDPVAFAQDSSYGAIPVWKATRWTAAEGTVELGSLGDPRTAPDLASKALAVNDAGLIVGWSDSPDPARGPVAVFWKDDVITELAGLGGNQSGARDVNSAGLVVGSAYTADFKDHAVLWKDGVPTDLGALGGHGGTSLASAINDAGWIVGRSYRADLEGGSRAVLWRDGIITDIGAPPGGDGTAWAQDINNGGDIVGTWYDADRAAHGVFLYSGGTMYDFRTLLPPDSEEWVFPLTSDMRINDAGWLTGIVGRDDGAHLYLFKPVPEPSAAGLALLSLTGALLRRRRPGRSATRTAGGARKLCVMVGSVAKPGGPRMVSRAPSPFLSGRLAVLPAGRGAGFSRSGPAHASVIPLTFSMALVLAGAAAPSARADAPRYTAVDLGTLSDVNGDWHGHLSGYGINNAGDVAGWGYLPPPVSPPLMVPVLYSGGRWVDLSSGGARAGAASGVSNTGTVVGSTYDPTAPAVRGVIPARATRWTAAEGAVELSSLGDPPTGPRLRSAAAAVNDAGLIVGWAEAPPAAGGGPHAVVWKDDVITALGDLGGRWSVANDVNSAGLVAGEALTADLQYRAVVWKDGVPTNLGAFSGEWEYSRAHAINDAGWIVGTSYRSDLEGGYRAVLWRDGVMTDLGTPAPDGGGGILGARALDINKAGDIMGTWFDNEANLTRAFLYTGGVMYDLRSLLPPGWEDVTVPSLSINDAGWFTGAVMRDGEAHLYLFKPVNVPEPEAAGLALFSLAARALVFRHRGLRDFPGVCGVAGAAGCCFGKSGLPLRRPGEPLMTAAGCWSAPSPAEDPDGDDGEGKEEGEGGGEGDGEEMA